MVQSVFKTNEKKKKDIELLVLEINHRVKPPPSGFFKTASLGVHSPWKLQRNMGEGGG